MLFDLFSVICATLPLFINCCAWWRIVFVAHASGGFYFGCKVKRLLSCSHVHRERSADYYCTCVLSKCMPDGRCCCHHCRCTRMDGSLSRKKEKKKEEALWFPPLALTSVINSEQHMAQSDTLAVIKLADVL